MFFLGKTLFLKSELHQKAEFWKKILPGNEVFQRPGFFFLSEIIHPLWAFLRVVLLVLCNDRELLWTAPGAAAAHISQAEEVVSRILFSPKEVYKHFSCEWEEELSCFGTIILSFLRVVLALLNSLLTAHSIFTKKYRWKVAAFLWPVTAVWGGGHTACAALHWEFILENTEPLGQNKIKEPQLQLCQSFLLYRPLHPSSFSHFLLLC